MVARAKVNQIGIGVISERYARRGSNSFGVIYSNGVIILVVFLYLPGILSCTVKMLSCINLSDATRGLPGGGASGIWHAQLGSSCISHLPRSEINFHSVNYWARLTA